MKKLMKILPVVMVACIALTSVFAITLPSENQDFTYNQQGSTEVENLVGGVWATVITVVQILAVAAVVFAGLRYMFASADQKADIKKSMGVLAIGAVLVFGATLLIRLIGTASENILK